MTLWKEVVQALTNCGDTSLSDSQLLREQYVRFILPFEAKFKDSTSFSTVSTAPVTKSGTSPSSHPLGNIDLSTMSYKTLSMFQSTANAPTPPFNQAAPNQSSQPPSSYAGTPSTQQPQAYPGTPTMSHLLPSYRNVTQPVPSMPGYCDPPSASPRVPGYPASPSPSLTAPGYPSHQLPGFTGTSSSSQLPGFHNPSLASQVPGYPSPRNAVAQEATYLREQQADFLRGPSHGMNKHYQHMTDSPQQHSTMFSNFSQQSQHPAGMMYPQHPSNISAQYSRRSTGGMASPKQRMQAMQNQWGSKYLQGTTLSDSGLGMGAAGHSQFHPSQSPGHKMAGVRPPPPYPLPKRDKSSPMAHPSTTSSQHQTLKMGVQRSPGRKEEGLFPSGCVESTKPMYSRKRRLTARDLGKEIFLELK